MIHYTGTPLVDAGVAVLENYLEKPCEEFKEQDLEKAFNWLKTTYSRKDIKGYLTVHFPNSGWCNPTILKEKKEKYIEKVLRSYKEKALSPPRTCAFCNQPAHLLADRQHIPLLTGATILVSAPYGITGLPVCGYCLSAIQFYPLATLKVQGKPLFWWSPDPNLTYELVKKFFLQVRKMMLNSSDKFPNLDWPRTRLLETAQSVIAELKGTYHLTDCFGYHMTNYGSGPDYQEYYLPKSLLDFLREVRVSEKEVRETHAWIVESQWERRTRKKANTDKNQINETDERTGRNFYYEDLSKAFSSREWEEEIKKIVRKYFIFWDKENFHKNCFALAELFLRKVGGMDKRRIDIIKQVADKITNVLILGNNEKRWLQNLYMREMKYNEFFRYLIKAQKRLSELKDPILLDEIIFMLDITNKDEVLPRETWLVRDLLLLRMLEQLGKQNQDIIKELELDNETERDTED
ncbi:MAG: hypothetical protein ACOX47_10200 [Bacillota bacterium]